MMLITLHNLAERYGLLPSEVLKRADTLDVRVLNVASIWENRKAEAARSGNTAPAKKAPTPSPEEMKQMIKRVREKQNAASKS